MLSAPCRKQFFYQEIEGKERAQTIEIEPLYVKVDVDAGSIRLRQDGTITVEHTPKSIESVRYFRESNWFLQDVRSEEHTSELQSLMRISYAVFCLKKKKKTNRNPALT